MCDSKILSLTLKKDMDLRYVFDEKSHERKPPTPEKCVLIIQH